MVKGKSKKVSGAKPNSNKQGAKIRADNQKARQAHKISSASTGQSLVLPQHHATDGAKEESRAADRPQGNL